MTLPRDAKAESTPLDLGLAPTGGPEVAILLCTFNGEDFLHEQLESIEKQTHKNWVIHASDDGSNDNTLRILKAHQASLGTDKLKIYEGPRNGFAKNFLSLIKNKTIQGNYFAFSDQDDVWNSTKLEKSISSLQAINSSSPSLYCSRVRLIDADKRIVGMSPLRSKPPSFKNALVQSLAGANTMLINIPARALLAATPDTTEIVAHDWLTYLLVTAAGGTVVYDQTPSLDYRQHDNNLIGNKTGLRSHLNRLKNLNTGRFSQWNDLNCNLLKNLGELLTKDNQNTLNTYEKIRTCSLVTRMKLFYRSGIYRQGTSDNLLLALAIFIKKI
jgi:glycosyltransferase involved in cell wall biosynthesis